MLSAAICVACSLLITQTFYSLYEQITIPSADSNALICAGLVYSLVSFSRPPFHFLHVNYFTLGLDTGFEKKRL